MHKRKPRHEHYSCLIEIVYIINQIKYFRQAEIRSSSVYNILLPLTIRFQTCPFAEDFQRLTGYLEVVLTSKCRKHQKQTKGTIFVQVLILLRAFTCNFVRMVLIITVHNFCNLIINRLRMSFKLLALKHATFYPPFNPN